jgi:carbon-monoxide dehydrogenase small subunit
MVALAPKLTKIILTAPKLTIVAMAENDLRIMINSNEQEPAVKSRTPLVHALRDEPGYTGPKASRESSTCGIRTVHLGGKAIEASTVLAVRADGTNITTVEGLNESGELHHIQRSFQEEHALQCGYCTPGTMMTAVDFLECNPGPDREEIREALEANPCRCTGYQNIVNAVETTASKMNNSSVAAGGDD